MGNEKNKIFEQDFKTNLVYEVVIFACPVCGDVLLPKKNTGSSKCSCGNCHATSNGFTNNVHWNQQEPINLSVVVDTSTNRRKFEVPLLDFEIKKEKEVNKQ